MGKPRQFGAFRSFAWSRAVLVFLLTCAAAACCVLLAPAGVRAGGVHEDAVAARKAYNAKIDENYSDKFVKGSHFLPSNATTDTGEFLDPKSFPTAQYCGHCHRESHQQWRESAHSNSNRAPWYLRNVNLLRDEKGIEFTRHCEGCHDPVAVVAGTLTPGPTRRRPFDNDGVTCSVCHAIQKVDTRGTGSYVLGVPAVLVDENGDAITRQVSDGEILAHLDRHSAAVMKPFYKTSEFCSSCHKAALPEHLNDYKWQRAISLYDEWQNSSFARQSPLPFYRKAEVSTCQTCHMQSEALTGQDPGAKHGNLASHRWLGANTVVPQYYKFDEQGRRVVEFLKTNTFNVDVFALEHGAPAAAGATTLPVSAPLGSAPFAVAAGELLTADVVIQNKFAHSHVPEQRDMYQSWVAFTITDSRGKVLKESGFVRPTDGELDPRAHSFTNRLINVKGGLNAEHQVWNNRVVAYNNTIQSGRSQLVRYAFQMPAAAAGPVTLTATVKYRRFNQHFMDFGISEPAGKHYEQPIVSMASGSVTIHVGRNDALPRPATPDPARNPDWQRWNNYGIALLDAQQYALSLDAFAHVAALRPDYADAWTNRAVTEILWQRYPDASTDLAHALKIAPGDARALYYRALVERNEGQADAAIADLQQVTAKFPRSRDAHRELGYSFYQQHDYARARVEYEAMQAIDPDDLAAHYNLAILYRRLGLKEKAAVEAARFTDQKDDPTASTYALSWLRGHAEIANESVAWHAHDLDAASDHLDGPLPTAFSATQQ